MGYISAKSYMFYCVITAFFVVFPRNEYINEHISTSLRKDQVPLTSSFGDMFRVNMIWSCSNFSTRLILSSRSLISLSFLKPSSPRVYVRSNNSWIFCLAYEVLNHPYILLNIHCKGISMHINTRIYVPKSSMH